MKNFCALLRRSVSIGRQNPFLPSSLILPSQILTDGSITFIVSKSYSNSSKSLASDDSTLKCLRGKSKGPSSNKGRKSNGDGFINGSSLRPRSDEICIRCGKPFSECTFENIRQNAIINSIFLFLFRL